MYFKTIVVFQIFWFKGNVVGYNINIRGACSCPRDLVFDDSAFECNTGGIGTGAIIGIVIGVLCVCLLAGVGIFYCVKRSADSQRI